VAAEAHGKAPALAGPGRPGADGASVINGMRARAARTGYLGGMDRRAFLATSLALPLAAALPAGAQGVDVSAINAYLQRLRGASGQFVQTNPNGSRQTGRFYLAKPGRIRFEYDAPAGAMVISDGNWVGVFDPKSNRNPTRYPLGRTPLRILLSDRMSLAQPGLVQGATRDGNGVHITAVDPNAPGEGRLVMTFSENPVALRGWTVVTSNGQRTRVDVTSLQQGGSFERSMFNIELAAARYR
jgi:outer membrane lipoprotein-sorting protein